ncbi:MAG TPA: hypothetical protein VOA80_19330, partial [Thermoanaerobaculia bacterium]|nr:hypothetical protein [Thermoanaerobaculia bacterium]
MAEETPARGRRGALAFYVIAAAVGIIASGLSFAEFFTSRFDRIAGNFGDARLIIYLHEHWYNVYRGREAWLSPPFFFPVKHVLAYSHTLFLQSLPYSLLRLTGLDPYVSFEATLLLFSWVGYGATVGLLCQLEVRRGFAIIGAVLFVFSNILHIWIIAPQSYTIMLIPLVLLWVAKAVAYGSQRRTRTLLLLSAAGISCSLILFSDFYTGWFFGFFALMVGALATSTHRELRSRCIMFVRESWSLIVPALLAASLALLPFIITYGPAILSNQGRPFDQLALYALPFADIVNVHTGNLVWGRLLGRIDAGYDNLGMAYGLPPGLLCGFVVVVALMLARRRVLPWERGDLRFALVSRSTAVVLLAWALLFKTRHSLLWHMVWHRVPGASAIRLTQRFQYQLSLAVVVAVVAALSAAWDAASRRTVPGRPLWRAMALVAIGVASAFLLLEQVNLVETHWISRREEQDRLGAISAPPARCESFFIQQAAIPRLPGIALQVDAMLISQRLAVPTINGYSGFNPPGWLLGNPSHPEYLDYVASWASAHHLRQPCAYQVLGKWTAEPLARP